MKLTLQEINACPILRAIHELPGINTMILIRRGLIPNQVTHQKLRDYLEEGRVYQKHGGFYVAVAKEPKAKPPKLGELVKAAKPNWQATTPPKPARRAVRFQYSSIKSNPLAAPVQSQAEARCEIAIQQLVNLGKPFDYADVEGIALVPAGFVKRTRRIEVLADRANRQIRQMARQGVSPC